MGTAVMVDGALRSPDEAKVSVFDRGFLFGDSVFETLRTYGGRPFALEEHLARIRDNADRVLIELPVSVHQLEKEIRDAVGAAGNIESYVRVMVTRGSGPLGVVPSDAHQPCRVIIVDALVPPPASAYAEGVSAITFRTQRVGDGTGVAGAKVGNYLVAVLAVREATRRGGSEALITDHTGRIVEGATSNVFAVRGGALVTAPESAGILPGVTRARVLGAAEQLGLAAHFEAIDPHGLDEVAELFISSSIRELLPVVSVDGRAIGSGAPGPVTLALLKRFRANVEREMAASA